MYILTVEQMRKAEAAANAAGQTFDLMMESAGQALAATVRQFSQPEGLRTLVLVGPGNNGGDGLVAAYHLNKMGAHVTCYVWKRGPGDANLARAGDSGCKIVQAEDDGERTNLAREAEEAEVILDALLGTGVDRPISGPLKDVLTCVQTVVESRRRHRLPWVKEALQIVDPTLKMPERPATPMVLAADAPSGLNCDSGAVDPATLSADVTVTFGFPKPGHFAFPGAGRVGKLLIAEIGIPPRLVEDCHVHLVTSQMVAERLPVRPLDAHKGTFGRALIVAGSVNYTGAPALAAAAAARVGAGLVTLALPERIFPIVATRLWEATYLLLPQTMGVINPEAIKILKDNLSDYQSVLIGPGLGHEKEAVRFVNQFLSGRDTAGSKGRGRTRLGFVVSPTSGEAMPSEEDTSEADRALPPLVIDADALNALAEEKDWPSWTPTGSVLTPHPGEMGRLLGCEIGEIQADRVGIAQKAAREWRQIVVLKGAHTVIASPDGEAYVLPFANPLLATAGTGDVLAGAIAGLIVQGLTPLDAAIVGAFLHGLTAEELEFSKDQEAGSIASDLLAYLPAAIQRLRT
jgi:ADP-dependent NAD(P)H-hydrate dehydratase / NAD(P)H-hydrate epimerase